MLKTPGLKNHENKIVVIVNISANCSVVIIEFLSFDLAVSILVIEVGKELHEDLVSGHFSRLELGVLLNIVVVLEILSIDHSITGLVESQKGLVNNCLPLGVELSSDSHKELVKRNLSISVLVEEAQKSIDMFVW